MKRLLGDLANWFDLDYRVRGVRLEELIAAFDVDLDEGPLQDFGTPGPGDRTASASRGSFDLHYVPHLFPGMEPKLQLAHRLQYHLLPTTVPVDAPVAISGVLESFCHLSGDLFGWQTLGDGRLLLWIIDVSGHGLETGLASAVLRAILDRFRDQDRVDRLVGEVNEAMIGSVRPGGRALFATGFFTALAKDGSAEYCSAGHPPALLVGPEGRLRELGSNSRPIGMFPGQQFTAENTRIAPDETLFLYTDGLIELTTVAGEQFGLARLRAFLCEALQEPRTLTRSLYREIARNHDMKSLDDDVTFLAARACGA